MAKKDDARVEEIVEQWRRIQRDSASHKRQDPLMDRIRERRERIFQRVGELDDSVDLIREDRER